MSLLQRSLYKKGLLCVNYLWLSSHKSRRSVVGQIKRDNMPFSYKKKSIPKITFKFQKKNLKNKIYVKVSLGNRKIGRNDPRKLWNLPFNFIKHLFSLSGEIAINGCCRFILVLGMCICPDVGLQLPAALACLTSPSLPFLVIFHTFRFVFRCRSQQRSPKNVFHSRTLHFPCSWLPQHLLRCWSHPHRNQVRGKSPPPKRIGRGSQGRKIES